jgi:hypothetical protein
MPLGAGLTTKHRQKSIAIAVQLGRNSLEHAFVSDENKERMPREYNERIVRLERQMQRHGIAKLGPMPKTRGFVCNRYGLCK